MGLYGSSDAGAGVADGPGGPGLPELPGVASSWSAAGDGHVPTVWSWLNTLEHARRITLIVFALVIVLFMCIAFELGRWAGQGEMPATLPPMDAGSFGYVEDDSKDFMRNVEDDGSYEDVGDQEPANATAADYEHGDQLRGEKLAPPVEGNKRWTVVVSETPSEVGMQSLLKYLDEHAKELGAGADVVLVPRGTGKSPNYRIVVGRYEYKEDAVELLGRVQKLRSHQGTYFGRSMVRLIEFGQ